MKFRSLTGSACCLLIIACGGADQDANAGEPEEMVAVVDDGTAIDGLTDYYQTHYNMGHASMVTSLYADEAVYTPANGDIKMGVEEITASMDATMAALSPELTVTQADRVISGDHAVVRGTYAITGAREGQPVAYGGAFLNQLIKEGDDWKLTSVQTNYDTEITADMWVGVPEGTEAPEEESMLTALIEGYETHYNLGHASMVADLYTEDAQVSFPGTGWISGREAVSAATADGWVEGRVLDIHGLNTVLLGDGMASDRGWYEFLEDGEQVSWGTYTLLAKQNADGEYRIQWNVSNTSPAAN